MLNQLNCHVARIDKCELAEMPAAWDNRQRGRYLRLLMRRRGIDPGRLYTVEYYPYRSCWVVTQNAASAPEGAAPAAKADESFYVQVTGEFCRTARTAFAAAAARSQHFAAFGCAYQLPQKAQEMAPAELRKLIGGTVTQKAA